jgi:exopolyphosphatase/guanosine-5'-triphosphate,3'-diphosphate pyrophosphatase
MPSHPDDLFGQASALASPIAVIDIGSNSGRVVVYEVEAGGHLRILASSRASLRLVRDLTANNTLGSEAMDRTVAALEDFQALARGSGAKRVVAVATSAIRDASNGQDLLARVKRELSLDLRTISGPEEARLGFLGAVRGLPVEDGLAFDLGGGSMQVSEFRARRLLGHWSFPLGALRLSELFLSDPPAKSEPRRLMNHVRKTLEQSRLPRLSRTGILVGTGGTVRNLAKIDQQQHPHPINHLHGHAIGRDRIAAMASLLVAQTQKQLTSIPGLNDDRADSIAGGGLAILALLRTVGADGLLVSGHGVREGLAAGIGAKTLPAAAQVRSASVMALATSFRAWNPEVADRRRAAAAFLFETLVDASEAGARDDLWEMLNHAATLLDIGSSIDFFERHQHVSEILLATDLQGFSHRQLALLAAVARAAGDEAVPIDRFAPLLTRADRRGIERAATLLSLADAIEQRCLPGSGTRIRCQLGKHDLRLFVPGLAGWRPRRIGARFEKTFGRHLVVTAR